MVHGNYLQLPPHIHMVYRQSNPHRTELISKHLRRGSNELDILKYLHAIQLQSPHTIWLIETIPPITRGWLILLELHSVRDQRFVDSHAQNCTLDVKPGNVVRDDVFFLQIIDFDVAIEVQDENMEVDEYRGTRGWTAPEMGEED
ncbi:hypothetical protein H4582DRAFT_2106989 [Lactarius indigo]|nr:hypothetical protein H4582DRAFT_2106989 [Lactarius indigo]